MIKAPAICVPMAVFTSDSGDKAVPFALKVHWFVIVVDKMVFPYAIFSFVGDWTVSTCKRKDAIFLASSVPTVPFSQRETWKEAILFSYANFQLKVELRKKWMFSFFIYHFRFHAFLLIWDWCRLSQAKIYYEFWVFRYSPYRRVKCV